MKIETIEAEVSRNILLNLQKYDYLKTLIKCQPQSVTADTDRRFFAPMAAYMVQMNNEN